MVGRDRDVEPFLPLPRTAMHILLALAEGDLHGWAIRDSIVEVSGGAVRPGPGTLYHSIARLEERGLIGALAEAPDSEPAHAQRRYFTLTRLGRRVLNAELDRLGRIVERADALGLGRSRTKLKRGSP